MRVPNSAGECAICRGVAAEHFRAPGLGCARSLGVAVRSCGCTTCRGRHTGLPDHVDLAVSGVLRRRAGGFGSVDSDGDRIRAGCDAGLELRRHCHRQRRQRRHRDRFRQGPVPDTGLIHWSTNRATTCPPTGSTCGFDAPRDTSVSTSSSRSDSRSRSVRVCGEIPTLVRSTSRSRGVIRGSSQDPPGATTLIARIRSSTRRMWRGRRTRRGTWLRRPSARHQHG